MACSITLQEYHKYFLLKSNEEEVKKEKTSSGTLTLATVYELNELGENVIYSKRIFGGGKHADPLAVFVQNITGEKGSVNVAYGKSLNILNGQNEDKIANNSTINVEIITSKSPSNVGADEIKKLLEYCKRNSIKISITILFGHSYSWDNKYNRQGIQNLHEKSVKLKPISFQHILNAIVNDTQDTLESLDDLQTSRGLLFLNYHMVKRSVAKIRDALQLKSDFYFQDNQNKLQNILGHETTIDSHIQPTLSTFEENRNLSLSTYRDYFLLQNNEEIWAKLKVTLSKLKSGVTQEHVLFEQTYNATGPETAKSYSNNGVNGRNILDKNSQLILKEKLENLVGDNISLQDINSNDEIVVNMVATVSEYPDRLGWHDVIKALHRHLVAITSNAKKINVESVIRYATFEHSKQSENLQTQDKNDVITECMTVQDILFEMIEDLEDSLAGFGRLDYGRGANLKVDVSGLSAAMGIINRAVSVRTKEGELHSMNDNFVDDYDQT